MTEEEAIKILSPNSESRLVRAADGFLPTQKVLCALKMAVTARGLPPSWIGVRGECAVLAAPTDFLETHFAADAAAPSLRKPGRSWRGGQAVERMTEHHVNKSLGAYMVCSATCDNSICRVDCKEISKIVDHLAAYEDTDLSLETVSDLLERFNRLYAIFDDLDLVDRVHFQAFLERVQRWYQAEKGGLLGVLGLALNLGHRRDLVAGVGVGPVRAGHALLCHKNHLRVSLPEIGGSNP